jgi:hypothetical protein
MRYPIFGVVLPSSDVTVYNDDGVTPATIYAAATGGAALVGGVVQANSLGSVIFYVDDGTYPIVSYFVISADGQTLTGIWSFFTTTAMPTAAPPAVGSTVTVLQIYNLALMAIGAAPLVATTDVSVQADVVRAWYPFCRDSLLRSHPWNFAEKRTTLTPVVGTTPTMDYAYFFDLPSDCLKLRKLSDEAVDSPYKVEGRRIACDDPSISILYTYRITDPTYFDPIFVDCLVAMLASKIAYPIRKDLSIEKTKELIFQAILSNAKAVDAQEGTADSTQSNDLLIVR